MTKVVIVKLIGLVAAIAELTGLSSAFVELVGLTAVTAELVRPIGAAELVELVAAVEVEGPVLAEMLLFPPAPQTNTSGPDAGSVALAFATVKDFAIPRH